MSQKLRTIAASSIALILTACGGGGGSDGGNIQIAADLATIDSQSAPEIAGAVVASIAGSQDLSAIGSFSVPTASPASLIATDDSPQVLAATIGPETVDCALDGSITLSGTVAVLASLTAGDSLSFAFDACDDADGSTVDGELIFEIVAFSGDIAMGMITLTVSMTLDQLEFLDADSGGSMNGELSFTVDTTNTPETFVALSSDSFTITANGETLSLGDFIVTITSNPVAGTASLDSSARISSSSFDGEISFVTTETLEFSGGQVPVFGQIVVTGADDATVTINILSADQIELEIDVDGNETIDEVIFTSWAELAG